MTLYRLITIAAICYCLGYASRAQIATDGTVGLPAQNLAGPDFQLGEELGLRSGSNLFHSFSQFNIQSGESATFTGAPEIQNILSRVTGGLPSSIDGALRSSIEGADFYFVNPAGVMFGPNATVDVSGSFNVSTADYIRFGGNDRFYSLPMANETFSVEPPVAFGFLNGGATASVALTGVSTDGPATSNFNIVSRSVAIDASTITVPEGNVNVIAVDSEGEVILGPRNSEAGADLSAFTDLGDIDIRNTSEINVNGNTGGGVAVQGNTVVIEDATISARTDGDGDGRGVVIEATDQVDFVRSRIDTQTEGAGDAGAVAITANRIVFDERNASLEAGIFTGTTGIPVTGTTDLSLSLDITHAFDFDLILSLTSPDGTNVLLLQNLTTQGADFVGTTFDDSADLSIRSGVAPFTGTFRPEESFAAFRGADPTGTWTLNIVDIVPEFDSGTLDGWSLTIAGSSFPSVDVPTPINDFALSEIAVDLPGTVIGTTGGLVPGNAGNVAISASQLDVLGGMPIEAPSASDSSIGVIDVAAAGITLDGVRAGFTVDDLGFGRFIKLNVVLDGSLGPRLTIPGPAYDVDSEFGQVRGDNLFHSFERLRLDTNEVATFSGPSNIVNIIARVTGGDTSDFDGTLRSEIDDANLFLINPAGVVFADNAGLDLSGSLYLATSDYLEFGDNIRFNSDPVDGEELSFVFPERFGFLDGAAGPITMAGSRMSLDALRTLTIVGGDITLRDSRLAAPSGSVRLVAVGSTGEAFIDALDIHADIDVDAFPTLGSLTVTDGSVVDADGEGGGRIFIRSRALALEDSEIRARTSGLIDGQGIDIFADDTITLRRSRIDTSTTNSGNAGPISLAAETIDLDAVGTPSDAGIFADSLAPPSGAITSIRLTLDISHSFDADLDVRLVNPAGREVLLFSQVGDNNDDFNGTTFDDDADLAIESGTAPFSGTFRPQDAFSTLFDDDSRGLWTLRIRDVFPEFDDGTLNTWSLSINGAAFPSLDPAMAIVDSVESSVLVEIADSALGRAGAISVSASTVNAAGLVGVNVTALGAGLVGDIAMMADRITLNGDNAGFSVDEFGVGRFFRAVPNVIVDDTLGTPMFEIPGPDYQIGAEHGQTVGVNLFHSFQRFRLDNGESATFFGPVTVENILARVTGGESSDIDGVIRSDIDGANLFLLNPAGVLFGPDASLSLPGSLYVSTGNVLGFADGRRFETLPAADEFVTDLSAMSPTSFGFESSGASSIGISGASLVPAANSVFSLLGGDIAISAGSIAGESVTVNLVAVDSAGEAQLDPLNAHAALDVSTFTARGDITIQSQSEFNLDGDGGGGFSAYAADITLEDSTISARTQGEIDGRGVVIDAVGQLDFVRSQIDTRTESTGDAGPVSLAADGVLFDAENALFEPGIFTSSLAVPVNGLPNVSLTLDITHSFDFDLVATLISPEGTEVQLFRDVGGDGDNFTDTVFDEAGSTPINAGAAPFAGTFRPNESFAAFFGEDARGAWTLEVEDSFPAFDEGTLNGWSLAIGGMRFESADGPQSISPLVLSNTVVAGDMALPILGREGGLPPGNAGDITIAARMIVEVRGDINLEATAESGPAIGEIFVTVPGDTITLNGFDAGFTDDDIGVGRFFPIFDSIIVDDTFGSRQIIPGPDYQITSDFGEIRGSNLFHSFERLRLDVNESATFLGPSSVGNIIARVTGDEVSEFDGLIRSGIDGANLFIYNPDGVFFGPNATLSLSGSFYVSTANYLGFDDGRRFDQSPLDDEEIDDLSAATPSLFGFTTRTPDPIDIVGASLQVDVDQDLYIVGGDVTIDDGARLKTEGGALALAGFDSAGAFTFLDGTLTAAERGVVAIANGSLIDVDASGSGRLSITAGDVTITDSTVSALTQADVDGQPIDILATGAVSLSSSQIVSRTVGAGRGGVIGIDAATVTFLPGARILTVAADSGRAGDISISAGQLVIDGQGTLLATGIVSDNTSDVAGTAGDIRITAGSMRVLGNGSLTSTTFGDSGGGIAIASDTVNVSDSGVIETTSLGSGEAGHIHISGRPGMPVDAVTVESSGRIRTTGTGSGRAGQIDILVRKLTVDGGAIVAQSTSAGGGDVAVNSVDTPGERVTLLNAGVINTSSESGTAGNIDVSSVQLELRENAGISSHATGASGNAGTITLNGGNAPIDLVVFADGAFVETATLMSDNLGDVVLDSQLLEVIGDVTVAVTSAGGLPGTIDLDSAAITLDDVNAGFEVDNLGVGHFFPVTTNIIFDGTLGPNIALTGPDYDISSDFGDIRGANLFHSFSLFRLLNLENATFSGPADIENIIGRVTGDAPSDIAGIIRSSIDGANLFLINPNGVIFGPGADLSLTGSLYISTADQIRFSDGFAFTVPTSPDEVMNGLSQALPEAFGFVSESPAAVSVSGAIIAVDDGMSLVFVGGGVDVSESILKTSVGTVGITGVGSSGDAGFDTVNPGAGIDVTSFSTFGDVTIAANTALDGGRGGTVSLRGQAVHIEDATIAFPDTVNQVDRSVDISAEDVFTMIDSRIDTRTADSVVAGPIHVLANEVMLQGAGFADHGFFAEASGTADAGDISVVASRIDVFGRVAVSATADDVARVGDLDVTADIIELDGFDAEFAVVEPGVGRFLPVHTNIVHDGSLGDSLILTGPDYEVHADLGQIRGGNLFHSFSKFRLNVGENVTFFSLTDPSIVNVIARVTGDTASQLEGGLILSADIATANLFLINSSGVILGPGASLELAGSLHLATGGFLGFADDSRFNVLPADGELLSSGQPTSFGFLDDGAAAIRINQSRLTFLDNQTFSMVGGEISVTGGNLSATSGALNIAAVRSPGEIVFNASDPAAGITAIDVVEFGDVTVSDSSSITVNGSETFVVRSGDLRIDNAHIQTISPQSPDLLRIDIAATGDIEIVNGAKLLVVADGDGFGGNASITARNLTVGAETESVGSEIVSETDDTGNGNGGSLLITVEDALTLHGMITTIANGTGDGGAIDLSARAVTIGPSGELSAITHGVGNGGIERDVSGTVMNPAGLLVDAEDIRVAGGRIITATTRIEADGGEGAAIVLGGNRTRNQFVLDHVAITEGGTIGSTTAGGGRSGSIALETRTLILSNAGIRSSSASVEPEAGVPGAITIAGNNGQVADSIDVTASRIATSSFQTGSAIQLLVADLEMSGGEISTMAGDIGGDSRITVNAADTPGQSVTLLNRSAVQAATGGLSDAGDIAIAAMAVVVEDSRILSESTADDANAGAAGAITVTTGRLTVVDDGMISTSGVSGGAGAVSVNNGTLPGDGDQEPVVTPSESIRLSEGGVIATSVTGLRDGGPIALSATTIELDTESALTATTGISGGNSGTITLEADVASGNTIRIAGGSAVGSSTAGTGNAGDIDIRGTHIDLDGGLVFSRSNSSTRNAGDTGTIAVNAGLDAFGDVIAADSVTVHGGAVTTLSRGPGASGAIDLDARLLTVADGTISSSSIGGFAGTIKVDTAGGEIALTAGSEILNSTKVANDAGAVTLLVDTLTMADRSVVEASSRAQGDAGRISIADQGDGASTAITQENDSAISTSTAGTGNAGNIRIRTGSLGATQSRVSSESTVAGADAGAAGSIALAVSSLSLDSGDVSSSSNGGSGGTVTINNDPQANDSFTTPSDTATLINGSTITTSSLGAKDAGAISLSALGIDIESGSVIASASGTSTGNAGSISLNAGLAGGADITVGAGAEISSSSAGQGDAGALVLIANEVRLTGGVVASASRSTGEDSGNAGTIVIRGNAVRAETPEAVAHIRIQADSESNVRGMISTASAGGGDAGDIEIDVAILELNAGDITSAAVDGAAGMIRVDGGADGAAADQVMLDNGSRITTSSEGDRNAGNIALTVNNLAVDASSIASSSGIAADGVLRTEALGRAGRITLNGGNIEAAVTLTNGAQVTTSTGGRGNAGAIIVDVTELSVADSAINSTTNATGVAGGAGGNIVLRGTEVINISDGASVAASTFGGGRGGRLALSSDVVSIDGENSGAFTGVSAAANPGSTGNGGLIIARADALDIDREGLISASTSGAGDAGSITVTTFSSNQDVDGTMVSLNRGSSLTTSSAGSGSAGLITVNDGVGDIFLNNGSSLNSETSGSGGAGSIIITGISGDVILDSGSFLNSETQAGGDAGSISIFSINGDLLLDNQSFFNSDSSGTGEVGTIEIVDVSGGISLDNGSFFSNPPGGGASGQITIIGAAQLTLDNQSFFTTETTGELAAGDITVFGITGTISILNGSFLEGATSGSGQAGNFFLESDTITLADPANGNSRISTVSDGAGNAGRIALKTNELTLIGGTITSASNSAGAAGTIIVTNPDNGATDKVVLEAGSTLSTSTEGTGAAGTISLTALEFEMRTGSEISSSSGTSGGPAGTITLNAGDVASESIFVGENAAISTSTAGTGVAGNIFVETEVLTLMGGRVTSASTSTGADAGDSGAIVINGRSSAVTLISVSDIPATGAQGEISTANRGAGVAGDVILNVIDLILDGGAVTSTSTNSTGGTVGGEIVIDADGGASGSIAVTNSGAITTSSGGTGDAGDIAINVRDLTIQNGGIVASSSDGTAEDSGPAGEINVIADVVAISDTIGRPVSDVQVRQRSGLVTSTAGGGDAGDITVEAATGIFIEAQDDTTNRFGGEIASTSGPNSLAGTEGGEIVLDAPVIRVSDEGLVSTSTAGEGDAGSVQLTTADLVVAGGAISSASSSEEPEAGDAGTIDISSRPGPSTIIVVTDGVTENAQGEISTENHGGGEAGEIRLDVIDLLVDGGSVTSTSNDTNNGRLVGGKIVINAGSQPTNSVSVRHGGEIITSTTGDGDAGNIDIDAVTVVLESGGVIASNSESTQAAGGPAGEVVVHASSLAISDTIGRDPADLSRFRSGIYTSTEGGGDAGDIAIVVDVFLVGGNLDGSNPFGGEIASTSGVASATSARGGEITLTTPLVEIRADGRVSTSTSGDGSAGTIVLNTQELILDRGAITSASLSEKPTAGDAGLISVSDAGNPLSGVTVSSQAIGFSLGEISTESRGSGAAGAINLDVIDLLVDGGIISSASTNTVGIRLVGGRIDINAAGARSDSIIVRNAGAISTSTLGTGNAGDINLETNRLILASGGLVSSDSESVSIDGGPAGTVRVSTDSLMISDVIDAIGAQSEGRRRSGISTSTEGGGNAGNITIDADSHVVIGGGGDDTNRFGGEIASTSGVASRSNSEGGMIELVSPLIEIRDSGVVSTSTAGAGAAGEIILRTDDLVIQGGGIISSSFSLSADGGDAGVIDLISDRLRFEGNGAFISTSSSGGGDAGDIDVNVTSLTLENDAQISSENTSNLPPQQAGAAGSIEIDSDTGVTLSDSSAISTRTANGSGGRIQLNTPDLLVTDQAQLTAATTGAGHAGDIILAVENLNLDGGVISSASESEAVDGGDGGTIDISAADVLLTNFGRISTASAGGGDGGTIGVSAGNVLLTDFGQISTAGAGTGDAGNIVISAGLLTLSNNALVSSAAEAGSAGTIAVHVDDTISLLNGSAFTTESASGGGGSISIQVTNLLYLLFSRITTSVAAGADNAGNIDIDPINVVLNNSQIIANAFAGNGGNITIITQHLLQSSESVIQASSQLGIDGEIAISSPDTDLTGGLVPLASGFLNAADWLVERCSARLGGATSTLTATGSGAMPIGVDDMHAVAYPSTFLNETLGTPRTDDAKSSLKDLNEGLLKQQDCLDCN